MIARWRNKGDRPRALQDFGAAIKLIHSMRRHTPTRSRWLSGSVRRWLSRTS